jgi:hypothetical protein
MSLTTVSSDEGDFESHSDSNDEASPSGVRRRPISDTPYGGIYSLPVVGAAASRTRQFYNDMAPQDSDATEVKVAKEVFRWGSVVVGAAGVAVVVL